MSEERKLLQCPWCGSEQLGEYVAGGDSYIQCQNCGACGPDHKNGLHWNTRITALLSAPAPEPVAWMPIETAPMDGTDVLIWESSASCGYEARYIEGEGWWLANNHPTDHWGEQRHPTHWMPLPLPPLPEDKQ